MDPWQKLESQSQVIALTFNHILDGVLANVSMLPLGYSLCESRTGIRRLSSQRTSQVDQLEGNVPYAQSESKTDSEDPDAQGSWITQEMAELHKSIYRDGQIWLDDRSKMWITEVRRRRLRAVELVPMTQLSS